MLPENTHGEKCAVCGHALSNHNTTCPGKPCGFCEAVSDMLAAGTVAPDEDGVIMWARQSVEKPSGECTCRTACRLCDCGQLVLA